MTDDLDWILARVASGELSPEEAEPLVAAVTGRSTTGDPARAVDPDAPTRAWEAVDTPPAPPVNAGPRTAATSRVWRGARDVHSVPGHLEPGPEERGHQPDAQFPFQHPEGHAPGQILQIHGSAEWLAVETGDQLAPTRLPGQLQPRDVGAVQRIDTSEHQRPLAVAGGSTQRSSRRVPSTGNPPSRAFPRRVATTTTPWPSG